MKTYLECPNCRKSITQSQNDSTESEFFNMLSTKECICDICRSRFYLEVKAPYQTFSQEAFFKTTKTIGS